MEKRLPSVIGMGLLGSRCGCFVWPLGEYSIVGLAAKLGLAGLGIGIFVSPNNSALMGAAPASRQGIAAGTSPWRATSAW